MSRLRLKVKAVDHKTEAWPQASNVAVYVCQEEFIHIRSTSQQDARLCEMVMTPEDALDYARQIIKVADFAMGVT